MAITLTAKNDDDIVTVRLTAQGWVRGKVDLSFNNSEELKAYSTIIPKLELYNEAFYLWYNNKEKYNRRANAGNKKYSDLIYKIWLKRNLNKIITDYYFNLKQIENDSIAERFNKTATKLFESVNNDSFLSQL